MNEKDILLMGMSFSPALTPEQFKQFHKIVDGINKEFELYKEIVETSLAILEKRLENLEK